MQDDRTCCPVCYASRSLSETEQRYAVIEKEALAATWACEKFADYVFGLHFTLEMDHRPLAPLLSSTDVSKTPLWILRFRLRMMRFNPEGIYVPGKYQVTVDTLSQAPVATPKQADEILIGEVETFVAQAVGILPATSVLRDGRFIYHIKCCDSISNIEEHTVL